MQSVEILHFTLSSILTSIFHLPGVFARVPNESEDERSFEGHVDRFPFQISFEECVAVWEELNVFV